ncbi:MAG TPA: response regulator transcription factor [Anaerolineaceae bacterium]|jgi:two-component system KDP operon response regulator KdpE|nr:response regulator transcription factor [Anaerolineaceae bacterium]
MNGPQILLIEDDPRLAHLLSEVLVAGGLDPLLAWTTSAALQYVTEEEPDLIALDVGLTTLDDLATLLRQLRLQTPAPVVLLLPPGYDPQVIKALPPGSVADTVARKLHPQMIVERLRTAMRRASAGVPMAETIIGPLRLDLVGRRALLNGHELHLSPAEFKLLCELARRPGRTFPNDHLLAIGWGNQDPPEIEALHAAMHVLRTRLGDDDPANPRWIRREPGVGYCLLPQT